MRHRVLEVVRSARHSGATVEELCEGLSLHESTVRRHLAALLEEGRLEFSRLEPGAPGRPRNVYRYRK